MADGVGNDDKCKRAAGDGPGEGEGRRKREKGTDIVP